MKNNEIEVYTDGSSLNNPGDGGWAFFIRSSKKEVKKAGFIAEATNNQMELTAMIKAMDFLANANVSDFDITLYSDSKYLLSGIEEWIFNWKKNGWKTANKKPVLNKALWQELDVLRNFLEKDNKLFFQHVKAHSGEEYNELVDTLARKCAEEKKDFS